MGVPPAAADPILQDSSEWMQLPRLRSGTIAPAGCSFGADLPNVDTLFLKAVQVSVAGVTR